MQEDFNKSFDQAIRSAFENAEVEVPSRVWSAVETSLNRQSAAALWWKRAGVALAAAAVILLGIVFSGTFSSSPSIDIDNSVESHALAQADATPAAVVPEPATVVPKPAAEESVQVENVALDVAISENNLDKTNSNPAQPVKEKQVQAEEESWVDPFAQMAAEDAKNSRRGIAFEAKGLLGSNGEISAKSMLGHMGAAPAITTPKTGISESSQSVFGLPLTIGLGARFYVSDKWSVGTGLNYSLLTRSFNGIYTKVEGSSVSIKTGESDITHSLQYVGIPVNVYYDILSNKLLNFYVFTGGEVERAISNKYRIYAADKTYSYSESVSGVQASAALGLGLQFTLTDHLGLYVDPSARYYFDCNQPKNVRTQKPLMFNFELGLRFNL